MSSWRTAANVPAIVAEDEHGNVAELSWSELRRRSVSLALELRRRGVTRGDRVAAWLPNIPEAVVAFLACASLGAIWTVCSPDMGTPAVLDRLRQTSPKVLIAVDGVFYGGRAMDRSAAVAEIRRGLPSVQTLLMIRSGYGESCRPRLDRFLQAQSRNGEEVAAFEPEWLPFDHPLWILYSSGTTGLPKAIVHGHGGIILLACAGHLHLDLGASYSSNSFGERFHWYSATGWVMWNHQVGALLGGTTICLFDGSPSGAKANPDWGRLWAFAARHRVTWFGAGAVFYSSCRKAGLCIARGRRSARRARTGQHRLATAGGYSTLGHRNSLPPSVAPTSGGATSVAGPTCTPRSCPETGSCRPRPGGCNVAISAPLSKHGTRQGRQ